MPLYRYSKKNEVTDSSAGGRNGVLANAPLAKTLLSLRPLSPPSLERGLVIRESLLVPAGPPASTPVTALATLTAETSVAAGGLGEECTLGRKLHFSFYAKAVPPPVSGSCEPYF